MTSIWATATIVGKPYQVGIAVGPHVIVADDRSDQGGGEAGPSPLDLVLAGLGACTAMSLKKYAEARRWPLEALEVDLRFTSRSGVLHIERILSVVGPLDASQRDALLVAANTTRVTQLLRFGLRIHTELA